VTFGRLSIHETLISLNIGNCAT